MSYIGKTPITGNFVKLDAISVVNGQAGYTMNNGGSAFTDYENVNQFLVSLNGILQAPTTSFTVSGSTLTFASNLATGDVIDFVIVLGNTLDIGTPSDATVTQAKTNFVSTSSSAGLQIKGDGTTDGTLQLNCSQNSHGIKLKSPAHSTSSSYTLTFPGTDPSADKFLKTDGSGNLSFADAGGGAFTLLSTTNVTSAVAQVDITSNIDSTYKNYMFVLTDVKSVNDDTRFKIQFFSSSGSPDTASVYMFAGSGYRSDNANLNTNSAGDTEGEISLAACSVDAGHRHNQFVCYLFNPSGTDSYKQMSSQVQQTVANNRVASGVVGTTYMRTVAVTGVRFKMGGGNITRGTFKLYGIS